MGMNARRLAASATLAAGIVAATALPASAAPGWGDNVNPGGGTVGLSCIYVYGANPPELCQPSYTPERDITPAPVFRNPFTALWDDLSGLFG